MISHADGPVDIPIRVADLRDLIERERRSARRRFWLQLVPGLGTAGWFSALVIEGVGPPAIMLTAIFGLLTWRVVRAYRRGTERMGELQGRLVDLVEAGPDR